jgi:hypothetical protein
MYRGRPIRNPLSDRARRASGECSTQGLTSVWADHLPPRRGSHRVQVACSDRGPWRVRGIGCIAERPLPIVRRAALPRS